MSIVALPAFQDNYIWLLRTEIQTAICVDPGEAEPVIRYLNEHSLRLEAIFLTHHHYDHCNGVGELLSAYPSLSVYGPNDPQLSAHYPIKALNQLAIGPWHFEIKPIPGHTATHVCFYESKYGLLFCGDTLFSAGCGRVFDGTLSDLYQSLMTLKALPNHTSIYCGHEYTKQNLRFALMVEPGNTKAKEHLAFLAASSSICSLPSTIQLEKAINPFFRLKEPEIIHFAEQKTGRILNDLDLFAFLREQKNQFS